MPSVPRIPVAFINCWMRPDVVSEMGPVYILVTLIHLDLVTCLMGMDERISFVYMIHPIYEKSKAKLNNVELQRGSSKAHVASKWALASFQSCVWDLPYPVLPGPQNEYPWWVEVARMFLAINKNIHVLNC